ncbi:MAG: WxcM-like domain-containing protein [Candidatus Methanoperedens sp.]|nr:WxcM-like domain-containing protein [Candidatus Methanoperedens sp.]MCZ7368979.1 WxcM-like domain-containing protein [Candidatus Methanoperedens sp.]
MLEKFLHFKTLASSQNQRDERRMVEERGELSQIVNGECFRHLVFIDIKKGFFRGKHYHINHEETFYVISGTVKAVFEHTGTKERLIRIMKAGDKVTVLPECAHVILALEYSQLVHFSRDEYDPADTYPYDFEGL